MPSSSMSCDLVAGTTGARAADPDKYEPSPDDSKNDRRHLTQEEVGMGEKWQKKPPTVWHIDGREVIKRKFAH